ncbi:MAG: AAA family ATPase [Colwellia sp.]|nr:AAA family ATPase [Colwellia sp.]
MLLKKINLKNFRQFYGDVTLSFNISNERNITIIHAENGVGKTALLNAVNWAFFEKLTPNFRNPGNLINDTAQKEGKGSCIVEIEFEDDNRDFWLIRRFDKNTRKSNVRIREMDSSVWGADLPEPELVINSILPKEMAEYFFFQGEGSNAVDTGNNQGNLAKSIRDILGFKVAESLLDTFKTNITKIRKEIASLDKSGESTRLNQEILDDENSLAQIERARDFANNKIPSLEKELSETEGKLSRINNQDLYRLRKEEDEAGKKLRNLKFKKTQIEKNKYEKISRYGWAVFGAEFAGTSLDFINESELKGRIPEPYNKTLIEDLLKATRCICKRELKIGSDEYKEIVSLLDKAANPRLMQRLGGIRAQIQSVDTLKNLAKEDISNIISQFDDIDEEIQKLKIRLKNLNDQILSIPEEEISKLQRIKKTLMQDLKNQATAKGGADVRIARLIEKIESNTRKLATLSSNSNVIRALEEKREFITSLQNFLSEYLSKMENGIRLHVLEEVNNTLDKFSRHDFNIKVSNDFRFYLKDKDNNNVGQGDGLNLLLNLTITAALISFAGKQRNVKDPILNSTTVAPLFIDAPFGVLDNKYRNVVVKELPKKVNQIVFLVSSSQWTEEMDDEIRPLINSEYCVILEESAPQKDKEVDKIFIQGKEIVMSRYGCEIDRTVIEELI